MAKYIYSTTDFMPQDRFGMNTPIFMITVLVLYLLLVKKIGPAFMKNRAAYQLKSFIVIYNMAQVLSCIYVVKEILNVTDYKILEFWKCYVVPHTVERLIIYDAITHFIFWLKISELTETIVFVLRKKQNQVSTLHVFHHCSTVTLIYLMSNHYKGLAALYPIFLNSNVHIIMYTYYLIAAVCDKRILRLLMPVKKSITILQMVQFTMILVQAGVMWYSCEIPNILTMYYCMVVVAIFYGFSDFYKTSYNNTSDKKNTSVH